MAAMTYRPREIVPRDGIVQCIQYRGTRDKVKKGTNSLHVTIGAITMHEAARGKYVD
jgi:hypothetical protein